MHWEIKRAKRIFKELSLKGFQYEPLLAATQSIGVVLKSKYENRTVVAQNNLETLKLVEPGNFVISLRSFQGGIELAHDRGIISPAYTVLRLNDQNRENYFKYLLKSKEYVNSLTLLVTGIREGQNIDTNKFRESLLFTPTPEEQTTIARFLDYKLAKINRFIRKKKQLIKLLNEQKAAIINQAVTKGLDPSVNLKDSGIEWLGEIPEHWEVKKIKYLGKAIIGLTYSPSEETSFESGTLVLRSSNVQDEKISFEDCVYVSTEIPEMKRTRIGDILICSRNGSIKLIGKNALIDEKSVGCTFGAFMTILRSPNFQYLHYFFNSASFKAQSGLFFTSTINQLTTSILNNIVVSIPRNIAEQHSVAEFIKKETAILYSTIMKIEKEIALVEEYKTTLIAEAVTGKIDLRDYKIPNIEHEEEPENYQNEELDETLSLAAEDEAGYQSIEEE